MEACRSEVYLNVTRNKQAEKQENVVVERVYLKAKQLPEATRRHCWWQWVGEEESMRKLMLTGRKTGQRRDEAHWYGAHHYLLLKALPIGICVCLLCGTVGWNHNLDACLMKTVGFYLTKFSGTLGRKANRPEWRWLSSVWWTASGEITHMLNRWVRWMMLIQSEGAEELSWYHGEIRAEIYAVGSVQPMMLLLITTCGTKYLVYIMLKWCIKLMYLKNPLTQAYFILFWMSSVVGNKKLVQRDAL